MPQPSKAPDGEPQAPWPPPPTKEGFEEYVVLWLTAFNHWHSTVDVKLAKLEGRTRDIRWILIGTTLTAAAAVGDLLLRLAQR